jgi:two-component system phosphate regulon response regulator PhoB
MQRILIIEDETDIADMIGFNLEAAGYAVMKAYDGFTGEKMAILELPNLIILDLMLPGQDGYAVFKKIRSDASTRKIPVIMLTARAEPEDRIQGLKAGADDYLGKPFSPKELNLRVQAVLNRYETLPGAINVRHESFHFDKNELKFYLAGELIQLTATEFKLLLYLTERAGQVQNRADLLRVVLGHNEDTQSRTLDTHMKRLRKKLGERAQMLETIRGIGCRVISN